MPDLNGQARLRQDSLSALERAETKVARELPDATIDGAEQLMLSLQTSALVGIAIGVLTLGDEISALRFEISRGRNDG